MGVIGLTAVEVLAFCLGLGLVLSILIVICNCIRTCCELFSQRRKKQNVEKLPEDYVDEIHQLLQRNRKVCEYDCVVSETSISSPKLQYMNDSRLQLQSPQLKRIQSPVHEKTEGTRNEENNNTNTTNSQSTITISEKEESTQLDEKSKRRTWGRLSNSMFDAVMMPSVDTTTTESFEKSPSRSIDNLRFGMKIETTV